MTDTDKLAQLEAEIGRLRAEQAELKAKLEPKPEFKREAWKGPTDYTEGASMPLGAMLEMAKAVPSSMLADIVKEQKPSLSPSPMVAHPPAAHSVPHDSWKKPAPLEPPPGMNLVDRVAEAFDRQDRVDLAKRILASKLPEVKP